MSWRNRDELGASTIELWKMKTHLNISIALEILFDVSVVEVEMGFPFHEGISNLH